MNYLYIGILSIAAIIIGLGIKLAITKANIKKKKELAAKRKELLAKRDHEIMEDTAKILEKFPPANGPDPIKEPDYDNQYTSENSEPLVIAEKDELTELSEKLDEVDTHGNVISAATDKLGIIASKPIPVEGVIDEESLKTIGEAVAALEPKKTRKKTTKKATKKPAKKPAKKATPKKAVKPVKAKDIGITVVEEPVKPKRKYTKKAKVTE
ncbi:MAG: hypothetical protein IJF83_08340 [Methanobrevibacter sp.]|nr:hypothetical protein [Methanobrevibacter sp.]MBR0371759.1 hypothetical protein [Methanobrevibacter sp.]